MNLLFKNNWGYAFYQNSADYYLTVVCGGVATYEITIKLNENEKQLFELDGQHYIAQLAKNVNENSSHFLNRKVVL